MPPAPRVIDFHMHFQIGNDQVIDQMARSAGTQPADPEAAERRREAVAPYAQRWRDAYGFPDPDPPAADWTDEADRWIAELDANGVEKAVFVTGGGNDRLARVVDRHPGRLLGFAHHDPFAPGAAEELERAVTELGLRGLKLFAPLLRHPLSHPDARPVWRTAARLGVPVLVHTGHWGAAGGLAYNDRTSPAHLEPVAREFPELTIVVPHFGVQFVQELLFVCWACPNVHVDTSGSNQWVRWMPYRLTLADLFRRFYETVGPERLLFGSDSSWFPRGYVRDYLADQRRICHEMNMPAADIDRIFSGNAERLLGLAGRPDGRSDNQEGGAR